MNNYVHLIIAGVVSLFPELGPEFRPIRDKRLGVALRNNHREGDATRATSMDRRSVALLIETSNSYARGLLTGILTYVRHHDSWSIFLPEMERGAPPPAWLNHWRGDGLIARIAARGVGMVGICCCCRCFTLNACQMIALGQRSAAQGLRSRHDPLPRRSCTGGGSEKGEDVADSLLSNDERPTTNDYRLSTPQRPTPHAR